jgi:hypothetical protein
VHSNERLTDVLEDGQREEGVGVEVCQHHPIGGQHHMEEKRHWRDHPRHEEAEDPRVPRPTTRVLVGVG